TGSIRKHSTTSCSAVRKLRKTFLKFSRVVAWNSKPPSKIWTRKRGKSARANIRAICCNASKISLDSDLRSVLHFGRNHAQTDQRFSASEITPALRHSAQNLILQ